jgi:glycosyltransferase involved in cell wall biosynthesis
MHLPSWFHSACFFHKYTPPPYGGVNQFLMALATQMGRMGVRVAWNETGFLTRACLFNASFFDTDRLRRARRGRRRLVHRIDGPVGVYRGWDDGTDAKTCRFNADFADATVLQSEYVLRKQRALGFEFRSPVVIHNAADPAIFHRIGRTPFARNRRIKLISSSWSDNPNKGGATYQWLDEHLDFDRFEYTFVGRCPVRFSRIRLVEPLGSEALAALLREHDIYITASLHDPCSNALLEALACGLPALCAHSGGHPELVGQGGYTFESAEEIPGLLDRTVADYEKVREAITVASLEDVAARYLEVMGIQRSCY